MGDRVRVHRQPAAVTSLVVERPLEQDAQVVLGERFQGEQQRP